jgi:hypothetical protein
VKESWGVKATGVIFLTGTKTYVRRARAGIAKIIVLKINAIDIIIKVLH